MTSWQDIASALAAKIEAHGFDVFGAVDVGSYNRALEERLHDYRLPELAGESSLVLVVGNTRRLWPLFLDAYSTTSLWDEANPLDAYSRLHLGGAAARLADELQVRHALRYSFDPPPHTVAIQRLALLAGVGELAPVGLCVHPVHGPWLSLRAALVFDVPGPEPRAAAPTCSSCVERPCLAARDRLLAATAGELSAASLRDHWPLWVAMREACPIGRASRYSDPQTRYHYLKQRSILREQVICDVSGLPEPDDP